MRLSEELEEKLKKCGQEICVIMDKYFPEVRQSWEAKDPGSFEQRVQTTLYLELIHAGFFNKHE